MTPQKAEDVDALIDHMVTKYSLTPTSTGALAKVAKAYKRATADFDLRDREAEDLRETADRRQRKRERLPEGLLVDKEVGQRVLRKVDKQRRAKAQAKGRTAARKELLLHLQRSGELPLSQRRLPAGYMFTFSAYLENGKAYLGSTAEEDITDTIEQENNNE